MTKQVKNCTLSTQLTRLFYIFENTYLEKKLKHQFFLAMTSSSMLYQAIRNTVSYKMWVVPYKGDYSNYCSISSRKRKNFATTWNLKKV